jgi:hypothetical protein
MGIGRCITRGLTERVRYLLLSFRNYQNLMKRGCLDREARRQSVRADLLAWVRYPKKSFEEGHHSSFYTIDPL